MQKLLKISLDILNIENTNMFPLLSKHGIEFCEKKILYNIIKNNPGLENVFCYYSEQNIMLGYFRYNFDNKSNIAIRSFQLEQGEDIETSTVVKHLLHIVFKKISDESIPNNTIIYTWVVASAETSIRLLNKLKFKKTKELSNGLIKFTIKKNDFITSLEVNEINQMFSQETHPGKFPTRVLSNTITQTVFTHKLDKGEYLKKLIEENKINPCLKYHISDKFNLIYVNNDSSQIEISEQFLAYLWSFIYSIFVIVEEGIQTKVILSGSNLWDGQIDDNRGIVKRAQCLYYWSKSLPKKTSHYPMFLPNPEIYYSAEEQYYIEKVNGIFSKSVTYLLNHEIAHLINKHIDTLNPLKLKILNKQRLTEDEETTYKLIEAEADQYAREIMIDPSDDDDEKLIVGLSIVLSHCASLFAIKHPSDLRMNTHPDIDDRLLHSLKFLDLKQKMNVDYIYLVGAYSINLFLISNQEEFKNIDYLIKFPKEIENPEDYFNQCLKIIDDVKDKYERLMQQ